MLTPLTYWYCDTCDGIIEKPEDGNVIWQMGSSRQMGDRSGYHDFKIVHKSGCNYDRRVYMAWMPLGIFLGEYGKSFLLSFLSSGPIIFNVNRGTHRYVGSIDDFVDLFRRVQTPYYEEARRRFGDESLLYDLSADNEYAPCLVKNLKQIIEKYPLEQP